MEKKNMIRPPVVLAVVCAVCCGLLAAVNSITKDKIAEAEAAAVQESLSGLPEAGTFEAVADFTAPEMDKVQATGVYVDENKQTAVLVTADGYNKGGLQVVVGLDAEGAVTGITFVSVTETPGLGTKVQTNPELLLDSLIGLSDSEAVDSADVITGATYSSNGMKNAVKCAMETFEMNKEAILK
ncbi:MAG: FMN-binding protein [Ruminococcus sp.]|nr:FMN-binding protein [Ruminococcus sp.]